MNQSDGARLCLEGQAQQVDRATGRQVWARVVRVGRCGWCDRTQPRSGSWKAAAILAAVEGGILPPRQGLAERVAVEHSWRWE